MVKKKWGVNDVTSQDGKRFIVTGSNTGTGFHIAKNLAINGGEVILACRNESKAQQAMESLCRDRFERFGTAGNAHKIKPVSLADMAARYASGHLAPKISA